MAIGRFAPRFRRSMSVACDLTRSSPGERAREWSAPALFRMLRVALATPQKSAN